MPDRLSDAEIKALAEACPGRVEACQLLEAAGVGRGRQPIWDVKSAEQFWREVSHVLAAGIRLDERARVTGDGRASLLAVAAEWFTTNEVFARAVAAGPGAPPLGEGGPAEVFDAPPPERTPACAPSVLLRAEYLVVPFVELNGDRAALRSWAMRGQAFAARLLAGPAGSGKTRLAMQVREDLRDQGWLTVLASSNSPLSPARLGYLRTAGAPTLVIVEDAELRSEEVIATARALAGRSTASRLLLLTRATSAWLGSLRARALPDTQVAGVFERAELHTITPLAPGRHARHVHFNAARSAFAAELGIAASAEPDSSPWVDLEDRETVLDVHAAALLAALPDAPRARPAESPLSTLCRHERSRWPGPARADVDAATSFDAELAARVIAVATLLRPGSADDAEALAATLPELLQAAPREVQCVVDELRRMYVGRWAVEALRPGAYGERIAAAALAQTPSLGEALAKAVTPDQAATVLMILGRALPAHPELAGSIGDVIRVDPERRLLAAIDLLSRLPDPDLFARAIGKNVDDIPPGSPTLFELLDRVRMDRGGPELDGLRAETLRTLTSLPNQLLGELRKDVARDPAMGGVVRIADAVTQVITDVVVGVVDPKSARMPENPDNGRPVIPPAAVDVLRGLMRTNWWRKPEEK
jgi:Effector-associated domain 1